MGQRYCATQCGNGSVANLKEAVMATGRCPACGSSNIERYKVVVWKCSDCGAIFYTPLGAKVPAEESSTESETPKEE